MLIGGSAHVGWMVHSFADDEAPVVKVVTVPGPPQVVQLATNAELDDYDGDHEATRSCDGDRNRNNKRKRRRRRADAEDARANAESVDSDALRAAIRCHAGRCAIGRAAFDTMRGSPEPFARQVRIVPSYRDGEMNGLKLFGIRSGSIPALLGLKNGDLVTEIAGVELDSMKRLMSLSSDLAGADTVTLEVQRRGETVHLDYEIR